METALNSIRAVLITTVIYILLFSDDARSFYLPGVAPEDFDKVFLNFQFFYEGFILLAIWDLVIGSLIHMLVSWGSMWIIDGWCVSWSAFRNKDLRFSSFYHFLCCNPILGLIICNGCILNPVFDVGIWLHGGVIIDKIWYWLIDGYLYWVAMVLVVMNVN